MANNSGKPFALKRMVFLLPGRLRHYSKKHSPDIIGKFGTSDADLKFQDTVEGNIFEMVDRVRQLLKDRYLISPITYEGIQRIEKLEYPEPDLQYLVEHNFIEKVGIRGRGTFYRLKMKR